MEPETYRNEVENQWCPGCSNFGILAAVKKALAALDLAPHEVCLVSGIGQAAKLPHYLRSNVFNGLHGRAIPAATGIKVANPGAHGARDDRRRGLLRRRREPPPARAAPKPGHHRRRAQQRGLRSDEGPGHPRPPPSARGRACSSRGVEIEPIEILATAIVHGLRVRRAGLRRGDRPPERPFGSGRPPPRVLSRGRGPTLHHVGTETSCLVQGPHRQGGERPRSSRSGGGSRLGGTERRYDLDRRLVRSPADTGVRRAVLGTNGPSPARPS